MPQPDRPALVRFDPFELDLRTRELRKDGRTVKLQDQPVKLLALLVNRAGELVTREEIEKALWGEDEFVEFEHAINTAVRKIRDALGDSLEKPRYIEMLARKGYRFIAPVEVQPAEGNSGKSQPSLASNPQNLRAKVPAGKNIGGAPARVEASSSQVEPLPPAEFAPVSSTERPAGPIDTASYQPPVRAEFALAPALSRFLLLAVQAGYLAIYTTTLYKAESAQEVLGATLRSHAPVSFLFLLVAAMCGIAVRMYLITSVGFKHPEAREKFQRLFPILFLFDTLWAASPLLLIRKIGLGLALGCIAALAYLPFAQRTLMQSIYQSPKRESPRVPEG